MSYYFSKVLDSTFEEAIAMTTESLKEEGFGVISSIEIHEKLKEKLGIDFPRYTLLGACNPSYAYKALQSENKIGTMLPCNVIVQQLPEGKVEVAAVNPIESMKAIQNQSLANIALEVTEMLKRAVDRL
jgi:uncharacterized protein (DUF302 family)